MLSLQPTTINSWLSQSDTLRQSTTPTEVFPTRLPLKSFSHNHEPQPPRKANENGSLSQDPISTETKIRVTLPRVPTAKGRVLSRPIPLIDQQHNPLATPYSLSLPHHTRKYGTSVTTKSQGPPRGSSHEQSYGTRANIASIMKTEVTIPMCASPLRT
jgi:hypothetical protein